MTTMASQISSLTVFYSIVYSGADQRKHQSSASLAFVLGIHQQMVNNAENVSIWWRHHVYVRSAQFGLWAHKPFEKWLLSSPCLQNISRYVTDSSDAWLLMVTDGGPPWTRQGLYSLRRRRLTSIAIPMINLRRSDDRLGFIMGIPILIRRRLLSVYMPRWGCSPRCRGRITKVHVNIHVS